MRVIAFYLPQFHQVDENDRWWGKGYTEWTAVKAGESYFEGHYQPHIPLKQNYYNLLDKKTMEWQAELMKKYNVYGMCFYHYYFGDGRKILEKPAENLLKWKEIDMPFCFSWANETWARTWSKIAGTNSWDSINETDSNNENEGILLRQEYGNQETWENHFKYFLPFFQDERYIKLEGKPVFLIYKPDDVECFPQMIEAWDKMAKQNGFKGIYVVATNPMYSGYDQYLRQESNFSVQEVRNLPNLPFRCKEYDDVSQRIVSNALKLRENCYLCGFTGHDSTPRRGKRGFAILNSTPDKFYELMKKLLYISEKRNLDYVFVNAWNEWGEGMHLEPDEKFQYGYLDALKRAQEDYLLLDEKDLPTVEEQEKQGNKIQEAKYKDYMNVYEKWLCIKEKGNNLGYYFLNHEYQSVAVYGMGKLGEHFVKELESNGISVPYVIDQNKNIKNVKKPAYSIGEKMPDADVIVVMITYDFINIYQKLKMYVNTPIISIKEVLDYVYVNHLD